VLAVVSVAAIAALLLRDRGAEGAAVAGAGDERRAAAELPAPAAKDLPDVILISIDTLRQDHLPFYGYQHDTAPMLTAFSRSAVVFDNAFTGSTNTAPAHATMLTGRHAGNHGLARNSGQLPGGVPTLGELLRGQGYASAAFVSGFTMRKDTGLQRGFDLYDDELTSRRERFAAETTARATAWLRSVPAERPVFLFLHLFDPHYPYSPPEAHGRPFVPEGTGLVSAKWKVFTKMREAGLPEADFPTYIARYDGEIHYADHHVGELLGLLEQRGRLERSLVIFTSDHGETLTERPFPFDHGCRLYDEQLSIPLAIHLPGGERAGQRVAQDVHLVDLLPTVVDVLGLEAPAGLDGSSLLPLARGAAAAQELRPMFSHARADERRLPELGVALDRWGFVTAIRRPPYKLIAYPTSSGNVLQLFDLSKDPQEQSDLSKQETKVVESYKQELDAWVAPLQRHARPRVVPPSSEESLRSLGYVQ